ncbi:DnaJ domain-containing protein [Anaerolineales bacterium HSG6]|nr:DnaJ domain-containing protein [Anaerolineales bacterium HSG6]MDM8532297.1 DnaJ domain-containing protein [Anaerolineales bacterium HSG25]
MSDISPTGTIVPELEPDFTASDPYQVLGVQRTATQLEIKRRYFELIRQHPPETEAETFKIIRSAYEKIKDVKRRSATDIFLPKKPPAWTPPKKLPEFDTDFYAQDVLRVLQLWGDLSRTDFKEDFKEIEL